MKSFLPLGHAELNYVSHRHMSHKKNSILYSLLLISVIAPLLAMPWIQIESATTSPGVIAPPPEPYEIRVRTPGRLNLFNLGENRFVIKGDTLFSIWQEELQTEEIYRAPLDGSVHNIRSEADESWVRSGELILEIRPDTSIVVKCYLPPDNIVSVQPDQKVEFQIHSIPNDTTRVIPGKVMEILPAVLKNDKNAVFEVRCSIDDTVSNDLRASQLKPGMTLLARFRTARKSAFDIILKDVEVIDQSAS